MKHLEYDETKRSICAFDCPDACGLIGYVKEGQLVGVGGDPREESLAGLGHVGVQGLPYLVGVQFPIAKAYAAMRAAELMVREATRKYEAGLDCGAEANMAKMLAADASWEAANACVQTHGGFAFAEEYDVERKFRETRLYQVAPISTNLILSYLAEHVLGMPRSY